MRLAGPVRPQVASCTGAHVQMDYIAWGVNLVHLYIAWTSSSTQVQCFQCVLHWCIPHLSFLELACVRDIVILHRDTGTSWTHPSFFIGADTSAVWIKCEVRRKNQSRRHYRDWETETEMFAPSSEGSPRVNRLVSTPLHTVWIYCVHGLMRCPKILQTPESINCLLSSFTAVWI